jgi:hypothetical protein
MEVERLAANDPQLTELVNMPRSVAVRELVTALALNTTLVTLDFGRRVIHDDDDAPEFAAFCSVLERNTTLKTLNMCGSLVGDVGAHHLAAALEQNSTLKELVLRLNGIGYDGAERLAAALTRNVTLTVLNLEWNTFGEAGAAALRAALETNCTLDVLKGVDGVEDILKRNREVRVARNQRVMLQFFVVFCCFFCPHSFSFSAFVRLWFCLG